MLSQYIVGIRKSQAIITNPQSISTLKSNGGNSDYESSSSNAPLDPAASMKAKKRKVTGVNIFPGRKVRQHK